jgi:hypothetical protein
MEMTPFCDSSRTFDKALNMTERRRNVEMNWIAVNCKWGKFKWGMRD